MTSQLAGQGRLGRLRWWELPEVAAIEQQVFGSTAWSLPQLWAELAQVPETRWYLRAVTEGAVVGYGGIFFAGGAADVQTLAVVPAWQGAGVGRSLLVALLDAARQRAARTMHLEVEVTNAPAKGLYEDLGFRIVGERRDYYGAGRHALAMSLNLGAAVG